MLTLVLENIEQYAQAHTTKEPQLLNNLFKETFAKTKYPNMLVGPLEGNFLKLLVKVTKPKRILEIGTFTGYSTLFMAEGLGDGSEILTLDIDFKSAEIAKQYWALSPHREKIKFLPGDALNTLKVLDGPFDMVFIDADKTNYINYWEATLPKLKKGGLVIADNVLWSGRVLNPKDQDSKALDAFNKHAISDKRVEVVLLTIRDGLLLAYKL